MQGRRAWLVWAVATVVAVVLMLPTTALGITMREGDSITVARGETISDDLYAFGNTVTIDGIVDGDVIAFGQIVVIGGEVRGAVITAANTVRVDGNVGGTVRAAGALVDVGGQVGGDVLAGANQVSVSGDVARDVAAGAQSVSITGAVGRNVMAGSESLTIAGTVDGDVEAQSSRVTVASQGRVGGDLDYWSEDEADVQGRVSGTASRHDPPTDGKRSKDGAGAVHAIVGAILVWVQSFIGFVLLGLLLVLVMPKPMQMGSQAAFDRALPSLGVGLLVFFGTPMAAGFVFVVGLFVGAWWLAFVIFMLYWLLLLGGLLVGSLAIGRAILRNASSKGEPALAWSLLLGLGLVWVVAAIPFLGWLAAWTVMLVGAGALVLLWMGKGQKPAVAAPAVALDPTAPEPAAPEPPPNA